MGRTRQKALVYQLSEISMEQFYNYHISVSLSIFTVTILIWVNDIQIPDIHIAICRQQCLRDRGRKGRPVSPGSCHGESGLIINYKM